VGRLGSGMRVSTSFRIISRPMDRLENHNCKLELWLGSEPHVVGRLGSRAV